MKFCTNCGQQIDDNAKFCAHCGGSQNTEAPVPRVPITGGKQLHCPKCKGISLSPVVETDVQGGYAVNRSVGSKWGASAVNLKSTHRDYWMCGQCGHKFRNLDNLNEEITVQAKAQRSCVSTSIVLLVLSLLCVVTGAGTLDIILLPVLALLVGLWFSFKKKVAALTTEKKYLEENCFN